MRKNDVTKVVKISLHFGLEVKQKLIDLLKKYNDIFAWMYKEMLGIHPSISAYHLCVDPHVKSKRQKMKVFNQERNGAIEKELYKIIQTSFICEVKYPYG